MKYAVVACTDGNFNIHTEHGENKEAAIAEFHTYSAALINDSNTTNATVKVVDENFNTVDDKKEVINKIVQPQIEE